VYIYTEAKRGAIITRVHANGRGQI